MSRTVVNKSEHLTAILTHLQSSITAFPIGDGIRPVVESANPDLDDKHEDPPYAILFLRPGGIQDGPISDSQADVRLAFQITEVGKTQTEALVVTDTCAQYMDPSLFTIPNRKIRDISKSVASDGAQRDDDVPTPVYYSFEVYDVDTVPA